MPLAIDRPDPHADAQVTDIRERRRRRGTIRDRGRRLTIGLVNNMPDGALAATERQFSALIETASGDADVRLRLYGLRQIARSREALEHLRTLYADASALRGEGLDALIVTGAQPVAPDLEEEPYWGALASAIDWAEANTISTILSCLAAHAGVRHFSGVARRALPAKCSGVFAFDVVQSDRLTEGANGRWLIPHSRHNGLDEEELRRAGYSVLTRSPTTGVDMFVRQMRSLVVFLQGHPEYESDTLAREYRRDVSRYLGDDLASLPEFPQSYFSGDEERSLRLFQSQARAYRRGETMAAYPDVGRGAADAPWRRPARLLYRNWLAFVAERKAEIVQNSSALKRRWGG
jgi:homoserine O-succinyltransferase